MPFHNKEYTIKDSKDLKIARFFIAYSNKPEMSKSFQLLSSIKQQKNLFLEFDSAFTNLPTPTEIENAAKSLLKSFQALGVKHLHQMSEAKDNRGLFGILNLNKTYTAYRIFAYIPDEMWRNSSFQAIIPRYGARYYICKESVDQDTMLEELLAGRIPEEKMQDLFDFIIYDCIDFGQMGIKTAFSKDELQLKITQ
ncbi:MAG TPA: hypothetical protein DDW50_10095 [Firmicutes bacterium]|jgi:hypothetical protein|nr:hypothetical protein [Bacillota bacterium]